MGGYKHLVLAYIDEQRTRDAALRAAGLVDENGEVRQVGGTLPVTKDGSVVGDMAIEWVTDRPGEPIAEVRLDKCGSLCAEECFWPVEECYSTREAAIAASAMKETRNGQ